VYVSVVIVSVSVILFVLDIERPQFGEFYNKKFIPAMTDISNIVPANESIVSSWDEEIWLTLPNTSLWQLTI
jgi:hypothetical protein